MEIVVQRYERRRGKRTKGLFSYLDHPILLTITLDVDAGGLVRGKGSIEDQYVNDRPYAALLSVALWKLRNTAMGGRSKLRQELADQTIRLETMTTPSPTRISPASS